MLKIFEEERVTDEIMIDHSVHVTARMFCNQLKMRCDGVGTFIPEGIWAERIRIIWKSQRTVTIFDRNFNRDTMCVCVHAYVCKIQSHVCVCMCRHVLEMRTQCISDNINMHVHNNVLSRACGSDALTHTHTLSHAYKLYTYVII